VFDPVATAPGSDTVGPPLALFRNDCDNLFSKTLKARADFYYRSGQKSSLR